MSTAPRKPSEEELQDATQGFRNGSSSAFQMLYRYHSQSVYRFCLRMVGEQNTAQDAFQETFIKVFEHRSEFRGDHFPAWLFIIARRVCLNHLRSQKKHDEFDEEIHGEVTYMRESDFGMKMCVEKALLMLPVQLREAAILREYEGYSYQEIASIVGIDLSLAKVRVHRARLLLKKILAPVVQEWYES
ncbi:MAG: RNA polymerase sigma factor [Ignavibacteria bacterium]|nr:RNA polymerase sigma factor [Ignavibacteria bacterium]